MDMPLYIPRPLNTDTLLSEKYRYEVTKEVPEIFCTVWLFIVNKLLVSSEGINLEKTQEEAREILQKKGISFKDFATSFFPAWTELADFVKECENKELLSACSA
jgi:hypothetical protein